MLLAILYPVLLCAVSGMDGSLLNSKSWIGICELCRA